MPPPLCREQNESPGAHIRQDVPGLMRTPNWQLQDNQNDEQPVHDQNREHRPYTPPVHNFSNLEYGFFAKIKSLTRTCPSGSTRWSLSGLPSFHS